MEAYEKKQSTTEAVGFSIGMLRGKHISASIIVLAGAILILGGSYIRHDDTKLFVQIVGCIFSAIGLYGWFVSSAEK